MVTYFFRFFDALKSFYRAHSGTILICSLFIIGGLFRFEQLMTRPFLEDEMYTLTFANADYSLSNHLTNPLDERPWLYYLFIKALYTVYPNPIILRGISLCMELLSIYILYRAIKKINVTLSHWTVFALIFSLPRIDYAWQIRDMSFRQLLASILIFLGTSLLLDIQKRKVWKNYYYPLLAIPVIIGCLTNYIFIVFAISFFLFMGVSILYLTKNTSMMWKFYFRLTPYFIPLALLLLWYLFGQNDTKDIALATQWIPKATLFTYLSITSTFLELTTYFDPYFKPTLLSYGQVILINICLCIFYIVTIFSLMRKKIKQIPAMLKIFFYGGVGVFICSNILVICISHLQHIHITLLRTFLLSGNLFRLSVLIGIYVWLEYGIKKSYNQQVLITSFITYIVLFLLNYSGYYSFYPFHSFNNNTQGDLVDVISSHYDAGDQLIFFPMHYQYLYIPMYFKNSPNYQTSSKLAYITMERMNFEDAILRKSLLKFSGDLTMQNQFYGKILFIEERDILTNPPEGFPKLNRLNNNTYFKLIKTYCLDDPITIDHSNQFTIYACWFKPEFQL